MLAHLLECGNHAGHCELRCVRDPQGVDQINVRGEVLAQLGYQGDAVLLDVAEGEFLQLRIDFTREQPPEQPFEEAPPEEGTDD